MKNLLFISFSFLFLFSCSSDDDYKMVKDLSYVEVNFVVETNSTGRDLVLNNPGTYKLFKMIRNTNDRLGWGGLYAYHAKTGLKVYDAIDPAKFPKKTPLYADDGGSVLSTYEKTRIYDMETGNPLNEEAKKEGYKLIEYKVEKRENGSCFVTNPYFKQ